jgi:hypothetical protein
MDGFVQLWIGMGVATLLGQAVILWMEVAAYRRHRHLCFLWLIVASVSGILYFVLYQLPYVVPGMTKSWQTLVAFATGFFSAQLVLGVCGMAALLRSYRALAEQVAARSASDA